MPLAYCGLVDSEDGTVLFGDAAALQLWRGSDEEPIQSRLIEEALEEGRVSQIVQIGQHTGVVWDIDGTGTVDVYAKSTGDAILVRAWLNEDSGSNEIDLLSSLPMDSGIEIAALSIQCGYLALLWSAESGSCIDTSDGVYTIRTENMATKTSGLIIAFANGIYHCILDEVSSRTAEARRCHIRRAK